MHYDVQKLLYGTVEGAQNLLYFFMQGAPMYPPYGAQYSYPAPQFTPHHHAGMATARHPMMGPVPIHPLSMPQPMHPCNVQHAPGLLYSIYYLKLLISLLRMIFSHSCVD